MSCAEATGAGRRPAAAPWSVQDLGRIAYRDAWEQQKRLVADRFAGATGDTLLVCEHDPVVTTGRGTPEDAVLDERFPVEAVERGGEATYHGPGQVVVYPVVFLAEGKRDLHRWLRALEQACVETLGGFGLSCGAREGATGVWVDGERKIVSIGVAAQRWVSWHGLALNHETDLEHFQVIRPCGFDAAVMTSMAAELGARCPDRSELLAALIPELQRQLSVFQQPEESL